MADITTNTLKIEGNNLILRDADAQAKLTTHTQKIAALEEDATSLKEDIQSFTGAEQVNVTMTSGYFINTSNGYVVSNANWSCSDYIECHDIVYIYANMSSPLGIAYYDVNKTFISGQAPSQNETTKFYPVIPNGAYYLRFNNGHNVLPDSDVVVIKVQKVVDNWGNSDVPISQKTVTSKESKTYTPTMESGYYISTTNGNKNTVPYGRSCYASDYIDISEINAIYTGMYSVYGLAYYDANKSYLTGLNPNEDSTPAWCILDPPQGAKYVRFSCFGTDDSFVQCRLFYGIAGNTKADAIIKETPLIDVIGMYENTIHIGDSLTWSQVWLSDEAQRQSFETYPEVFGKLCGVTPTTLAFSGATCITWWAEFGDDLTSHGLHIVFLGTNGGLTDTIATDCVGTDPANFADDTNTGCYGKILQTISNNGDKAVLVHVFHNLSNASITNSVIDQFGERYDFPVIDIDTVDRMNHYYHDSPTNTSYSNTLHFNELGYAWLANIIRNKINALSLEDKFNIIRNQT